MLPERPTVSVIVPVFDVAAYLPACVDSVLAQTYSALEVVLVDDGSTDGSSGICDGYASRDSRVRVVHQRNAGLSGARNAGIDASSGPLVTFLDGDDWWEPAFVERLAAALDEHPDAGVAMSTFARVPGAEWVPPVDRTTLLSPSEAIGQFAGDQHTLFTIACAKLVRRSVLDDVRFPEGRTYEDEFTTYRLLLESPTVLVPEPLYLYRQHQSGIMSAPVTPERLLDDVQAAAQQSEDLRAAGHDRAAAWADDQSFRKRLQLIALLRESGRRDEAARECSVIARSARERPLASPSRALRFLRRVGGRSPVLAAWLFTGALDVNRVRRRAAGWGRRSTSAVAPRGTP
ncbi:MAG TPA: glycosyltransferase family 2 protein [Ornithinibacter sp.]|nr:glycosyltransferase family 2 protein [Ornithinibacter sp.]